jgi:ubiquinone/menaquinone biosynthesis C-methylase UbiE
MEGNVNTASNAVREFFDCNVEEWDTLRYQDETYVSRGRVALRWLRRLKRGKRVLDMGCGTGRQTLALLETGDRVVAVDFSEAMVQRTRARILRERPGSPALVVVADALRPPFRDGSFDAVLALGVVGFNEDRTTLLKCFNAVLRPQGSLVCDAGLPEPEVLFQAISRRLTRIRELVFRQPPGPNSKGWYSEHFVKQSPGEFERLLKRSHFIPVARGGAGFGELRIHGSALVPWRVQSTLARVLSWLSMLPGGKALARHALTYVVWSQKRPAHPSGE